MGWFTVEHRPSLLCSYKRKERKTSPPVTGLISSHKQAASGSLGLRDSKKKKSGGVGWAAELHNPSPGCRQCHKVSHDWLNKNTTSAEGPGQDRHPRAAAPPLKGRRAFFVLPRLCGSFGGSAVKPVIHSDATLAVFALQAFQWFTMMNGKLNRRWLSESGRTRRKSKRLILSLKLHFFGTGRHFPIFHFFKGYFQSFVLTFLFFCWSASAL